MANICENTLRAYSENSENLECIENFFKDLGDVERVDDENLEVYFKKRRWISYTRNSQIRIVLI